MTMLQSGEAAAPSSVVKDTTTQTFVKDVIEESKRQPVLVDFWAEWCGPCKQLGPVLEKVVRAAKGKVKLVKMDIDKHPTIPGQLGIQSIPAVFAFVNGQPDRKSTRLNSSHLGISYAVLCLKKKKKRT